MRFALALLPLAAHGACPPTYTPRTIDFAGLPLNTPITNVEGFAVKAVTVGVGGISGAPYVYPTDTPGGEDPDLEVALGNALIIQNATQSAPNDSRGGGTIMVDFGKVVILDSVTLVDTEVAARVITKLNGNTATNVLGPNLANSGVAAVSIGSGLVNKFKVIFPESGALAQIDICEPPVVPPQEFPEFPDCPAGMYQQVIDLNEFEHDETPTVVNGFTLSVGGDKTLNIYDTSGTSTPYGTDPDLEVDIGNVLIIQNETVSEPNDSTRGGLIRVDFPVPLYLLGVTYLDTEKFPKIWTERNGNIVTKNKRGDATVNGGVAFLKVQDAQVDAFRFRMKSSGALVHWVVCTPCPVGYDHVVVDFAGMNHGDDVTIVNGFDFTSSSGPLKIYDSDSVHPNDPDLQVGDGNLILLHNVTSPFAADDRRDGGNIKISFPIPGFVKTVTVVDTELQKNVGILTQWKSMASGNIDNIQVPPQGSGSVYVVDIHSENTVDFMRVRIPGADALSGFDVCLENA